MNYGSLKGLVETVLKNYKCPECNSEVNESNIEVIGAAGNTINIDVECAECGKHSMIKSEIVAFDLSKIDFNNDFLKQIKTSIENIKTGSSNEDSKQKKITVNEDKKQDEIRDEKIIELNNELKKRNISAFDLFGEDK